MSIISPEHLMGPALDLSSPHLSGQLFPPRLLSSGRRQRIGGAECDRLVCYFTFKVKGGCHQHSLERWVRARRALTHTHILEGLGGGALPMLRWIWVLWAPFTLRTSYPFSEIQSSVGRDCVVPFPPSSGARDRVCVRSSGLYPES